MDGDVYREGLRQRGLIDLLEAALSEAPPGDEVEAELLRREILLATADDASRTAAARRAALDEANGLLRSLISTRPADPRALQWRLERGQSLLYKRGDPYSTQVLYRGGTAADRRELARIMIEAIGAFDDLKTALQTEYVRLDQLSLGEFERLERKGYIERLDRLLPQAQAMRRWAVFYRALARDAKDPHRIDELRSVVVELRDQTDLLETPHPVSHYQCQSLLLSGMCVRRLGDYALALEQLTAAVSVVEELGDPVERRDLQWAVTLAGIERVRTLREARRYEEALDGLEDLRTWIGSTAPSNFGLQLVTALLESSVVRARARRLAAAGNAALARRVEARSRDPLITLARQSDAYRDAVYAAVYEQMEADQDPEALHPFERCALVAGLLGDAERGGGGDTERIALLDRAISVAHQALADTTTLDPELHAEVLYNLAVASHRRGLRLEAAGTFLEVGRDFATFRLAEQAATLAVQGAWELHQDLGLRARPEVQELYLEALVVLTERHEKSPAAAYWQFFRAQALEEREQLTEAARQYARVSADHEFYLQARFLRARCLAGAIRERVERGDADPAELAAQTEAAIRATQRFIEYATQRAADEPQRTDIDRLVARALVNQAELTVLPGLERNQNALTLLEGFEQRPGAASELIGRVLRVRIIAYQALGKLAEAEQAIPEYIKSDPANAGATLQELFNAIDAEVRRLRRAGRDDQARQKAESALLLARKLFDWAQSDTANLSSANREALQVQLGEAALAAGHPAQARQVFTECLQRRGGSPDQPGAGDLRVTLGLAEALFQLDRFSEALPLYSRVYGWLEQATPLWWRALLGDLRCRTELDTDPAGVIRVIRQHRFLRPDMGGPELKAGFDDLLKRNER
ncbi:MAG: hypothetical protein IID40_04615 [Planctomycetes bacterium]|nr:hypothetical protein [Planctomycetota bacterium]